MSKKITREQWYFVRIAFLAVPWKKRGGKNPKGTLFKQYFLIKAKHMTSARNKAKRIISVSESRNGTAEFNGQQVDFMKIGIMDLDQLTDRLVSGVEILSEY